MSLIQVHDKSFEPYLSEEELGNAIKKIAGELNRD